MTGPAHRIRRGASLYSFQEEHFLRTLSLEDCVRVAGEIGARGIEIIPEQSIPGFPHLTDEFVDSWFSWMERYGTTPVATDLSRLADGDAFVSSGLAGPSGSRNVDKPLTCGAPVNRYPRAPSSCTDRKGWSSG